MVILTGNIVLQFPGYLSLYARILDARNAPSLARIPTTGDMAG
jgi:hypothetical protein